MTEEVDYDSSDGGDGGRGRSRDRDSSSPVVIKGRGHARFNRGGEKQGRGGFFETIPQPGLRQGEPAQCKSSFTFFMSKRDEDGREKMI